MMMMQIQIHNARDIDSHNGVVVAGILNIYMLDKGVKDLQTFWNICINKPNVIFATTSPRQKLLIVQAVQKLGGIVIIDDSVNDSLPLKKPDIGVAIGITGTEVAKEAADMILSNCCASIANGVRT